jgi:hypothetical protein
VNAARVGTLILDEYDLVLTDLQFQASSGFGGGKRQVIISMSALAQSDCRNASSAFFSLQIMPWPVLTTFGP